MEAKLKLENRIGVELGYLEKYRILSRQDEVGRISMVKFQIDEPFKLGWTFLNEICIEPKYRQKGIAKNVIGNISDELSEKGQNGILMNAVTIKGAKTIYDHLGWKRFKDDSCWQILINVNVSEFSVRKTQGLVAKNLLGWQASSIN